LFRSHTPATQDDLVGIERATPVAELHDCRRVQGLVRLVDDAPLLPVDDDSLHQVRLLTPLDTEESGVCLERDEVVESLAVAIGVRNDPSGAHIGRTDQLVVLDGDRVVDGSLGLDDHAIVGRGCRTGRGARRGRHMVVVDRGRCGGVAAAGIARRQHEGAGDEEAGGEGDDARAHDYSFFQATNVAFSELIHFIIKYNYVNGTNEQ